MLKFEIDFLEDYSDESLLNEIRRVAEEHPNEKLTRKNFESWSGRISAGTICRRFDNSWEKSLEKAGLADRYMSHAITIKQRSHHGRNLTNDELIAEMKRIYAISGRKFLTTEIFNEHSIASAAVVQARFGSWTNALNIAGIPQSEFANKNRTTEQFFENIAAVWTYHQRRPLFGDMSEPPSEIPARTYVKRWGTWRKSLSAFADSANSEEHISDETSDHTVSVPDNSETALKISRKSEDSREVRPALRIKVFTRDHFRCKFCGRSPATHLNVTLHADHIVAFVNGGKTILDNLQTLCNECNLGKGKMILPSPD
jgi:hypothetical protein